MTRVHASFYTRVLILCFSDAWKRWLLAAVSGTRAANQVVVFSSQFARRRGRAEAKAELPTLLWPCDVIPSTEVSGTRAANQAVVIAVNSRVGVAELKLRLSCRHYFDPVMFIHVIGLVMLFNLDLNLF